jgi:hypothetical protein
MRVRQVIVALTMVTACGGVEGPVLYPSDAGAGGSSTGTGGAIGTGGLAIGTGGATLGTGGLAIGTGGAIIGAGGSALGTGGRIAGTGGRIAGTGGRIAGTGGTTLARGGATGTGGKVTGTGGSNLGRGGATGGSGGAGGSNPDAGIPCSSWTTADACKNAGCMPINGAGSGGLSEISTFFECREAGACPAVIAAASPPGEPYKCFLFASGCIPTGWTLHGSECRSPTITALKMGLNCMPGPAGQDPLVGSFDVEYDNTDGAAPLQATVTSAWLSFPNSTLSSIPFAVIPSDSGTIPAGERLVVNHRKDPASQSGFGCPCSSSISVMLTVSWKIDGEYFSDSFGPSSLGCSF